MDGSSIFIKSDAGLREVQHRTPGFPPRLRQLLILIDGTKCFDDFLGLQADRDTLAAQLRQLIELQLVTESGQPAFGATAPAAPTPTPAPTSSSTLPSVSARQKVRRIISMTDQAYLANKLEFMLSDVYDVLTNREDLQFCIDRWQKALKDAGHTELADAYLAQVRTALRG